METLARRAWILGVLGFFCFVVFASWWYVTGEIGPWATGFGIAAGVLLAAYAALDRDTLGAVAGSRAVRYGAGATLATLLVGGICVTAYAVVKDHDKRWDLTEDRRFTLSENTLSVLDGLDRDVEVYAFFRNESPEQLKFRDLLAGYSTRTDKVRVQLVDPLREPLMAERFTITTDHGTVVILSGEDRQRLETDFDEEAVTNAIVRLVSGEDHRVCWALGHGEADPDDDRGADGFGAIVVKLEDTNYTVEETLIPTTGIPRRCEALVVARPTTEWLPAELEALAAYVAEGGRVLMLLEPFTVPALAQELERFGLSVGEDVVLDTDPSSQMLGLDASFLVLSESRYAPHPITKSLRAIAVLGITRSVSPLPGVEGLDVRPLATASEESWGETDPRAAEVGPDPATELVGNVPVIAVVEVLDPGVLGVKPGSAAAAPASAAPPGGAEGAVPAEGDVPPGDAGGAVPTEAEVPPVAEGETPADPASVAEGEAPADPASVAEGVRALGGDPGRLVPSDLATKAGGRMVVFGDADFATNQLVTLGNNQDLFLNSVAWLLEEESQLGDRPDDETDALSMNILEEALMWLVSVVLVPGAAVLAAILVTIRRRFL